MTRVPALVGEAPARYAGPERPLSGRSGRALCWLAGWDASDPGKTLSDRFFVVNVLAEFPGRTVKGTAWPIAEARDRAAGIRESLGGRSAVVLLGKRVAAAFGVEAPTYFVWRGPDSTIGSPYVVLPHPSGVNRVLNDPSARRTTGRILREAAEIVVE